MTWPDLMSLFLCLVGGFFFLAGTASVRLRDTILEIHVLDQRLPNIKRLKRIEEKVAALFSINPPSGEQTPSL